MKFVSAIASTAVYERAILFDIIELKWDYDEAARRRLRLYRRKYLNSRRIDNNLYSHILPTRI